MKDDAMERFERHEQKETVIYGGAFNPPTLAHVAILKACFEYAEIRDAEVWVMPSGDRVDKTIGATRERRLEYTQAMINDAEGNDRDVSVQTLELDRPVAVETIDTLHELQTTHPDRTFSFVFGADSTETMADWKGGEELLEELPMLVVEREGSRINPLAKHVTRLSVSIPGVSSTLVRQRLEKGEAIDDLVSPHVALLLV